MILMDEKELSQLMIIMLNLQSAITKTEAENAQLREQIKQLSEEGKK
jgi:hypothetical protein